MSEDLALAFVTSARPWFQRFTHHIENHGPGYVEVVIAEPHTAFDKAWQLLVVDAGSTFLDRHFVDLVHQGGGELGAGARGVIAVWDPTDPRGKQRALDAGVDEFIAADASVKEFARLVLDTAPSFPLVVPEPVAGRGRRRRVEPEPVVPRAGRLVVVGGPPDADAERVALGLAHAAGGPKQSVVLIDANDLTPSVAARLALAPVPNLASAVTEARDAVELDAHLQAAGRFWVLAGMAEPATQWGGLAPTAVASVVSALTTRYLRGFVLVGPVLEDIGRGANRFDISRAVVEIADVVVAVSAPTRIGLVRVAHWVDAARKSAPRAPLHIVVTDAPRDGFRRGEITDYLAELAPAGIHLLAPERRRRRRAKADWNGDLMHPVRGATRLAREVAR